MGIRISGTGSYLPPKVVTNHDLSKIMDTNHQWIVERSGIEERHFADEGVKTFELAVQAAKKALIEAHLQGSDIDAIIVATTTSDQVFPSTAVHVQREIGASNAFAFDVQAVCAGFIYALSTARSFILSGQAKRVLVIGAEKFSSLLDFTDRTTAVLFADGAGAIILEHDAKVKDLGASWLKSNGDLAHLLYCDTKIHMEGAEVFKNGIRMMADAAVKILEQENISLDQIDFIIPHQANIRMIEGIAQKLSFPLEKIMITINMHGNTSAASIPLALDHGVQTGKIKRGDKLLCVGLGGGLAWGSFLLTY
jgi:3-oxoacyl-[acyl-carrier-protein] synthase-3